MQTEVLRKLDAGLLSLVTGGGLDRSGEVPVFIRAAAGQLDRLLEEVDAAGGRIRHRMPRFNAVAAWVPIQFAADLATRSFVERVEMSQPVELA